MPAKTTVANPAAFATRLRELRMQRKNRVTAERTQRARRTTPPKSDRAEVLRKTNGRCHICGGAISSSDWEADHVMAYSAGGAHAADNYLPAHSLCNNYRWHYDAEEFQWILKLGVWVRTQIEKGTSLGLIAGRHFCDHERRRAARRKS